MYKLIYLFVFILPYLAVSQSKALHTRILINAWSEYDSWTHLDPFYLDEPFQDVDNFRPVDYEERHTYLNLDFEQLIMPSPIGFWASRINFTRGWRNRKHIQDSDIDFEYNWPMTPYQTKSNYIKYAFEIVHGFQPVNIWPYIGLGGDFRIDQITSSFIYIDNQTNAAADPIQSIPVDERVERRFRYYAVAGMELYAMPKLIVMPYVKLFFNEIDVDDKMIIKDRTDEAQFRPGIKILYLLTGRDN
tara:strand:+ start:170 stop:907 length:738 start_codon:yes stop_codon:yes gene_type:complete